MTGARRLQVIAVVFMILALGACGTTARTSSQPSVPRLSNYPRVGVVPAVIPRSGVILSDVILTPITKKPVVSRAYAVAGSRSFLEGNRFIQAIPADITIPGGAASTTQVSYMGGQPDYISVVSLPVWVVSYKFPRPNGCLHFDLRRRDSWKRREWTGEATF